MLEGDFVKSVLLANDTVVEEDSFGYGEVKVCVEVYFLTWEFVFLQRVPRYFYKAYT